MWNTPCGVRVLSGAEGKLFQVSASIFQSLLIDMKDSERPPVNKKGVDRFEQLHWYQQVVAIGEVSRHLLGLEDQGAPPLWAWNELTIYKVYEFLFEVDDIPNFGTMVMDAALETKLIRKRRKKLSEREYSTLLGRLVARVLYDRDINPEDVDMVKAQGLKSIGLSDDYFGALFPAFSMDRFTNSLNLLNSERVDEAIEVLPCTHKRRFDGGLDECIEIPEALVWHPYG